MSARPSFQIRALLVAFLALALGCSKPGKEHASETEVMFAVAASLRNVMPELAKVYADKHPGTRIAATYGASGDLQKQVEGGAPIDGVIFASAKPVGALIRAGRVDSASQKTLAQNRLVLIGPKGSKPLTFITLESLPAKEKIAIGDPGAVPAGQYARDYLQKLGKWSAIQDKMVFGGDVAAVLAYARRGEVAAAIVYKTEVRGIDDVTVFDETGADAPRIEVVGAVVSGTRAGSVASSFLAFMASPEGQEIMESFGFEPP
jgi:molybdate transport system substrate-binding protein